MSRFVLGPSVEVTEEVEAPPAAALDAQLEIVGTRRGGFVDLRLLPHAPEVNHPINVYAFFASPVASIPALADRTPEWFFAPTGGVVCVVGSTDTRQATDAFVVAVPGVAPGAYFLQTVLEFAK